MAGGALEEELSKKPAAEEGSSAEKATSRMDALMKEVAALSSAQPNAAVPAYMLQMLSALVDLRKTGWGAQQAQQQQQQQHQQQQQQQQVWSEDPNARGGGGGGEVDPQDEFELTAEEEAFMKEHLGADILGEDDDDEVSIYLANTRVSFTLYNSVSSTSGRDVS